MLVFQPSQADGVIQVIDDVVEITVGNEIVTDLTDPVTIDFYHNIIEVSLLVFVYLMYVCMDAEEYCRTLTN